MRLFACLFICLFICLFVCHGYQIPPPSQTFYALHISSPISHYTFISILIVRLKPSLHDYFHRLDFTSTLLVPKNVNDRSPDPLSSPAKKSGNRI